MKKAKQRRRPTAGKREPKQAPTVRGEVDADFIDVTGKGEGPIFFGNIPHRIEADWDKDAARLAGFPLNILYSGIRRTKAENQAVSCCYWFNPRTFMEDAKKKEMAYFPKVESPYWLNVRYDKKASLWQTFKYKGKKLLCMAEGPEFDGVMIQTTLRGPEADEPVDSICGGTNTANNKYVRPSCRRDTGQDRTDDTPHKVCRDLPAETELRINADKLSEIDCPKRTPQRATWVVNATFGRGGIGEVTDRYFISTNRPRSHWIFWQIYDGDVEGAGESGMRRHAVAWCRKVISRRDAAKILLRAFWSETRTDSDNPPCDLEGGLLTTQEVEAIADEFCGDDWR